MVRARRVALAAAALALVATTASSAGFTSVSADRGVEISTAPDSHAFLTIDHHHPTLTAQSDDARLVNITNQFAMTLTSVTVTVTHGAGPAELANGPVTLEESLHPGGSLVVTVPVECDGSGHAEFVVSVDASGPEATVDLTRTVGVVCPVESDDEDEEGEDDDGDDEEEGDDEDRDGEDTGEGDDEDEGDEAGDDEGENDDEGGDDEDGDGEGDEGNEDDDEGENDDDEEDDD
jgi:hypothetical protein